ncbi:MAG TPA: type II CAAX endopeptidase family protein [Kofleriaceae bacterium]|nr:type II CAAX endopeptidase family protein [Kofleriaceae bacterium]
MRDALGRHRIATFLVVTYAVTWGAWIPLAIAGRHVGFGSEPLYLLGLLGPAVGAIATTALADGAGGLRDLGARMIRVRAGWRWWLVALGLPIATYAVTYVVLVAYSVFLLAPVALPTRATLGELDGFPVTNVAALLAMLVAIHGFGEEAGWRGFLLPALQRRRSPLVASLLVAACWAPWHLPAFLVADTFRAMPAALIPMWLLGLASGSVVLAWLYNRGRRSVVLVAACHGAFNLFSGTFGVRGPVAAVETLVVIVVAAVLAIQELRATWSDRSGRAAHHAMAPRIAVH